MDPLEVDTTEKLLNRKCLLGEASSPHLYIGPHSTSAPRLQTSKGCLNLSTQMPQAGGYTAGNAFKGDTHFASPYTICLITTLILCLHLASPPTQPPALERYPHHYTQSFLPSGHPACHLGTLPRQPRSSSSCSLESGIAMCSDGGRKAGVTGRQGWGPGTEAPPQGNVGQHGATEMEPQRNAFPGPPLAPGGSRWSGI